MSQPNTAKSIRLASTAAAACAAVLLLGVVLPAEYGWDPLGTGRLLGLTGLADTSQTSLNNQEQRWQNDTIEFQLSPFEAVEYKYRLNAGDTVLFSWLADGELLFDMHSEPDGAAPGYAESFDKARAMSRSGSFRAPFGGIHGWFWQNRGSTNVTLTLDTRGYYSEAIEMRDGHQFHYSPGEEQPVRGD